jgi:hypothetical protein
MALIALGLLAGLGLLFGILYIRIKDKDGKEKTIEVSSESTITITDEKGKTVAEVSPATAGALATQKHKSGLFVDVLPMQRTSDGYLKITWRYRNPTAEPIRLFEFHGFVTKEPYPEGNAGNTVLKALYYVADRKKTQVVQDGNHHLLAFEFTTNSTTVDGKSEFEMWAKFPAPPDSCKAITLYMQSVSPFEDLPVPPAAVNAKDKASAVTERGGGSEASEVLASRTMKSGLVFQVTRIERGNDGYLKINWRYRNPTGQPIAVRHYVFLGELYFVANDETYRVATKGIDYIAYGPREYDITVDGKSDLNVWAKFPAPPSSCKSITLYITGHPPFENLPVQMAEKK